MTDGKLNDTRPWLRKKTNWGKIILGIAATLAVIPGTPVLFTVGSVSVTTAVLAVAFSNIGAALTGYGKGHRKGKDEEPYGK